jgi:DNA (cytosine-5)-methyltransferase 3A
MNVLSLFDGISCARIALENVGFTIKTYYTSEVCDTAIKISDYNFTDNTKLGDIENWKNWSIDWKSIDLIVAGSPCQGFSRAGKELNFNDSRSKLFFVFVDILNYVKSINSNVRFLLENVRMRKEYEDIITDFVGIKPIMIDGKKGFLQSRPRLYWFNFDKQSDYVGVFKDISCVLDDECDTKVFKLSDNKRVKAVTENERGFRPHRGDIKKTGIGELGRILKKDAVYTDTITTTHAPKILVCKSDDIYYRYATIAECEKLSGLPVGYTKNMSYRQALKAIGNGWHVGIVTEIFKGLKPNYQTNRQQP